MLLHRCFIRSSISPLYSSQSTGFVRFFSFVSRKSLNLTLLRDSQSSHDKLKIFQDKANEKYLKPYHFDIASSGCTRKDFNFLRQLHTRTKELNITPNRKFYSNLLRSTPSKYQLSTLSISIMYDTKQSREVLLAIANEFAVRGMPSNVSQVLDVFEQGNEEIDILIYNIFLKAASNANATSEFKNILELMNIRGIEPDAYSYGTIISGHSKLKEFKQAFEYLNEACSRGISSTKSYYHYLINLVKAEEFDILFETLQTIPDYPDININSLYLTTIMKIFQLENDESSSHALSLFALARYKKCVDITTYSSIIHHFCLKKDAEMVNQLLEYLKEDKIKPDLIMYTSLIGFNFFKNDIEEIKKMMEELKESDITIDWKAYRYIVNIFINNDELDYLNCYIENDKNISKSTLERIYNRLLKSYCLKKDITSASIIFHKMAAQDIPRTEESYSPIITHYGNNSDSNGIDDLVKNMLGDGIPRDIIMKGLFKVRCSTDDLNITKSAFNSMRKMNFTVTEDLYLSLVSSFVNTNRGFTPACYKMLHDEMKTDKIKPSIIWFERVIKEVCKTGTIDFAMQIVRNDMSQAPSTKLYSILFTAFTSQRGCREYLTEMKDSLLRQYEQIQPELYRLLLKAMMKQNLVSDAKELLQNIESRGNTLDCYYYNCIIRGHVISGDFASAMELIEEMLQKNIKSNYYTFEVLYNNVLKKKDHKTLDRIRYLMEKDGLDLKNLETMKQYRTDK